MPQPTPEENLELTAFGHQINPRNKKLAHHLSLFSKHKFK